MTNYIIRRFLLNLLVLLFVASIVFFATNALPSDFAEKRLASSMEMSNENQEAAIEEARRRLGLDKPLAEQYVNFIANILRGDLGTSYETQKSTWQEVGRRIKPTLELGILTTIISFSLAIPIGVISAVKQNEWMDYVLRIFAILGVAMPVFVSAIFLSLMVVRFDLFTIDIVGRPNFLDDPIGAAKLYVIPAFAGGVAGGAGIMRILRSQMLEVLRQDYIRTARAKGLLDRQVWMNHALKNAMLPVLTVMGLTVANIVSGQIILENMFNIDGIGRYLFQALQDRDFPPFQGTVLLIAAMIVTMNLLVDLVYGWLDPRIRYQ